MDAGLTISPVAAVPAADYTRPTATVAAAPTQLPPEQTVTPAADAGATRNDPIQSGSTPQSGSSLSDYDTRSITIDPQSREVIFRIIDSRTNQVVSQVPDETMLRNRAYSLAIANGSTPYQALTKADLEA